jgi:hypothetical protein
VNFGVGCAKLASSPSFSLSAGCINRMPQGRTS